MGRRISILVAATTSAVVLAFLIPLALLVQSLAEDRATAGADAEARDVAILVSSLHEDPALADAVAAVDVRSTSRTTVVLAEGARLGSGDVAVDDPDVIRARAGAAFTRSVGDGRRTVVPVLTSNGTDVVVTEVTGAQLHRGVSQAWTVLGVLGALMLVAALGIADRFGRRISAPVVGVAGVADQLREGDLTARAVVEGSPETKALAVSLNRLGERINELLTTERAAVGDLSHRLRTPVTALRIDVDGVADPALAERLRQHVGNLQRTVDAVVRDARRPVEHTMAASCDAVEVVRERVAFWSALAEDQGRDLGTRLDHGRLVVGLDPRDLSDVVDILVDNVFAHTAEGIGFAVTVEERDGDVVLGVVDRGGPGTTRSGGRHGTSGLGLQIVRRTVAAASGTFDLVAAPGGTRAMVRLPLVPDARER
ncbi:MAG: HAMP domain-containing sensor histidine kinase [Propionibacteriales bacterium]|nr:HAMP domain-containing sensor histidine kinase [Propionibacteriales bacterium]